MPNDKSVRFATVNLGLKPPVDLVESMVMGLIDKGYIFGEQAKSPDLYLDPPIDINVAKDPDANGNWTMELFERPGQNFQTLVESVESACKLIRLELIKPFDLGWRLAKVANSLPITDEAFLLGDIVVTKSQKTSRGTYAGDADDVCYNDDIVIINSDLDYPPAARTIELVPCQGPFHVFCKGLRGMSDIENGTDNPAKRLAHDRDQTWFHVELES